MKNSTEKVKWTCKELGELMCKEKPYLIPNRINVGKWAKDNGFVKFSQKINGKLCYFYYKKHQD